MKKVVVCILMFSLLIISFVSAISDENQGVPSLLSEIKEILQNILEKLNIIAEKETNVEVTVEPNITVNPPIVNVNQNITLTPQNKTCEWEKYNQDIFAWGDIFAGKDSTLTEPRKDNLFMIPNNILYSEIRVVNASINGICTPLGSSPGYCDIKINNVDCVSIHSSVWKTLNKLPESCSNSFKSGINNVSIDGWSGLTKRVNGLSLEMEIKPANC